ncbi:MAG TPA: helix-turn-helix transcriptional regulator [Anaerolineales bacterium]|nr:helix-turn-helix transcriptional regulator [Anaerolineales bacterium]HRF47717.1 helix-turn-helix transcriptional regulator [Anaerolineales bacterium]
MPKKNPHIGSGFDDFLKEEGLLADVIAGAAKRNLVMQFEEARKKQRLTKSALAQKAGISRMQLDRVLDPDNLSASLKIIAKVSTALGKSVYFKLL